MAKKLYGYSSTYGAAAAGGGSGTPNFICYSWSVQRLHLSFLHFSDSSLRYDPDHSKYSSSSIYGTWRYSATATSLYLSSQQPWPPGVDHMTTLLPGSNDTPKVPLITISKWLPERPGEPDCPYCLKTQKCKFGLKCKFNDPKDKLITLEMLTFLPYRRGHLSPHVLFGATCKFHRPKDIQIPLAGQENGNSEQN